MNIMNITKNALDKILKDKVYEYITLEIVDNRIIIKDTTSIDLFNFTPYKIENIVIYIKNSNLWDLRNICIDTNV